MSVVQGGGAAASKPTNKSKTGQEALRPKDILAELDDSDSENDISTFSSRTPIGKYFNRDKSPAASAEEEDKDEDDDG